MAKQRHLPNPPVAEAIVDIRTKSQPDVHPDVFDTVKARLGDSYPQMTEMRAFEAMLEVRPGPQPPSHVAKDLGIRGYQFKASDGKQVAQYRTDGFTFNRLRPYTEWESVFPEAMRLWNVYAEVARPLALTRLALRYINRIPFPEPYNELDFDDYLTAAPRIPEVLPQVLNQFLTRVTVLDEEQGVAANIVQALEKTGNPRKLFLLLDIDAYAVRQLDVGDPIVEETFSRLREFKNLVFFGSLTEKTVEQFL